MPLIEVEDKRADLHVISLCSLLEGSKTTEAQLLEACTNTGFFYLDLRGPDGDSTLADVESLFKTSEALFSLDVKEKIQYVTENYGNSKIHGYRGLGMNIGPLKGKRDGFESFMISELALFGLEDGIMPFAGPAAIQEAEPVLRTCVRSLHDISTAILTSLHEALGMRSIPPFQDFHRQNKPSMTGIGLLHYLPLDSKEDRVGHLAHTDAGSLSIVFTNVGGLQVLVNDDSWRYIEPRPGHAVVNVGDTLTFLSKGMLKSSLHRVVPLTETGTSEETKYTVVYLMRPELDTLLQDDENKEWTAAAWHNNKFNLFRHGNANEFEASRVLNGRKNFLGFWEPESR